MYYPRLPVNLVYIKNNILQYIFSIGFQVFKTQNFEYIYGDVIKFSYCEYNLKNENDN